MNERGADTRTLCRPIRESLEDINTLKLCLVRLHKIDHILISNIETELEQPQERTLHGVDIMQRVEAIGDGREHAVEAYTVFLDELLEKKESKERRKKNGGQALVWCNSCFECNARRASHANSTIWVCMPYCRTHPRCT